VLRGVQAPDPASCDIYNRQKVRVGRVTFKIVDVVWRPARLRALEECASPFSSDIDMARCTVDLTGTVRTEGDNVFLGVIDLKFVWS
jgi:hypothetical protein